MVNRMDNALTLAAEVLEKAAAYIEAVEADKRAAAEIERDVAATAIKTKVAEATGQELSDEQAQKLAAAGPDVLKVIEKLAESVQAPESLGGPGETADSDVPHTTKEAAAQADDRFASWLAS